MAQQVVWKAAAGLLLHALRFFFTMLPGVCSPNNSLRHVCLPTHLGTCESSDCLGEKTLPIFPPSASATTTRGPYISLFGGFKHHLFGPKVSIPRG